MKSFSRASHSLMAKVITFFIHEPGLAPATRLGADDVLFFYSKVELKMLYVDN